MASRVMPQFGLKPPDSLQDVAALGGCLSSAQADRQPEANGDWWRSSHTSQDDLDLPDCKAN